MDYKNKYNNALEKLQEAFAPKNGREISGLTRACIEEIFPELKESEDERIRKEIIATIHLYYGEPLEDEAKEMISWLEKQGNKPQGKTALEAIKEEKVDNSNKVETNSAWSEEDETILDNLIYALANDRIGNNRDEYVDWLKSIKERVQPQPKQEWSEEDEKIELSIEQVMNCASLLNLVPEKIEKVRAWLKSLKGRVQPQNLWKPSDEQIKALEYFIRGIGESGHASPYDANLKLVHSLLNNLKKLK